tara:strand:- start:7738 stop:8586 length:849 start_codon:yes stop_codon:yes gene_type:complete
VPYRDLLLTISVPFLWGVGFVISKPAMEYFPPMLLNGLRWSITGIILCWWFPFPKEKIWHLLLISFIGCTIQYTLTFSGLNLIEASSAVLLVQSEVPFGVLIAMIFLKEKPKKINLIALLFAFCGLYILTGSPTLENKIEGVLLVLGGALTWSVGQVIAKPVSQTMNGIHLTAWLGILAGPQLILASYFYDGNSFNYIYSANLNSWLIVIYLGIMMNIVGYSTWYYVLGKYPVNKVISAHLLLPIIGVLTAIIFLGERPENQVFIGGAVVLISVAIILYNKE